MILKQPQHDGTPPVVTTMRIPEKLLRAADRKAASLGMTRSFYVVYLLEKDVKRRSRSAPPTKADETSADVFG